MLIKPSNLVFLSGTAVIMEGLKNRVKWNGQRGIVQSFAKEKARYRLAIKGQKNPLHVKQDNCRLESVAERGSAQQPEPMEPEP